MSLTIGLTGNIGSGKSTICRIFEVLGIPVYYSDESAKQFLTNSEIKNKLVEHFGNTILNTKEIVDTKALAAMVFSNSHALQFLNNLIHPLVISDYKKWLQVNKDAAYTIMESAIIFESNLEHFFDKTIFIACPSEIRMNRIIQRDNTTRDLIQKRFDAQLLDDEKINKADIVINNNGSIALIPQVMRIDAMLKAMQ